MNYSNANDGCFWISFNDYDKFFYITTVCYYRDTFIPSIVCDEHELGGFGLIKFSVPHDMPDPMILSIS